MGWQLEPRRTSACRQGPEKWRLELVQTKVLAVDARAKLGIGGAGNPPPRRTSLPPLNRRWFAPMANASWSGRWRR